MTTIKSRRRTNQPRACTAGMAPSRRSCRRSASSAIRAVQFATFPETVVPYYPYFSFVQPRRLRWARTSSGCWTGGHRAVRRDPRHWRRLRAKQKWSSRSASTSAMVVHSIIRSCCSMRDGTLIQRRRKITPTYHERMIWGQGDGSAARRRQRGWSHRPTGVLGVLQPLARYALIADGEQIHSAMYPGSRATCSPSRCRSTSASTRWRPLASSSTPRPGSTDQQAQIMKDTGCSIGPISSGCFTAIVAPDGTLMGEPLRFGRRRSSR